MPVPSNDESLAIPRAKLDKKTTIEQKIHKKKHRKVVNIKGEYIRSLLQEIENLKALNDQQKAHYEAELKVFKDDRATRDINIKTDLKNSIAY